LWYKTAAVTIPDKKTATDKILRYPVFDNGRYILIMV
jgi:hypothetical protein